MPRKEEPNNQQRLNAAKKAYKAAMEEGNRQEEARWANVVGDILKNRGEYVEALVWLRKDYDVSTRYLPEKQLLATCQSIGELHLRLQQYDQALIYQKKHLDLARDQDDIIEQQRASTQLGRTYHEKFMNSEHDHSSVRCAKKYFKSAMALAQTVMNNPHSARASFVKEYIDAHNNIGMLEMDLDNLDEAEKILCRGINICDEEEVGQFDDARSRLHHNLGSVYLELRKWNRAHEHMKKDIIICKRIGHRQGEAKGYINLGELHYRNQRYTEALASYEKALDLAKSLEDEHSLVDQIDHNIETVKEAIEVMNELKKEEQNFKKLERNTEMSRGTENEWNCLTKQNVSLDSLIEKSKMIFEWIKLREYAKKKKRVVVELCDKEKVSDSFFVVGEAYQKLRKYSKALKWYRKSLENYRLIGNLEGQAMVKINVGNVLDSCGDWAGALEAFREGYKVAVNGNLPSSQLSALENMHYSHMIRFDDAEEARRTKLLIDKLKKSINGKLKCQSLEESCSETKTDLDNHSADDRSDGSFSGKKTEELPMTVNSDVDAEFDESIPLASIKRSIKKPKKFYGIVPNSSREQCGSQGHSISRSTGSVALNRKRFRVIISDDEGDENQEISFSGRMEQKCPREDIATSDELMKKCVSSPAHGTRDVSPISSRCMTVDSTRDNAESGTCSFRPNPSKPDSSVSKDTGVAIICQAQKTLFRMDEEFVHLDLDICGKLDMEYIKVEVACLYYLQLPREKRSRGLVPVIQHMKYDGEILESVDALKNSRESALGRGWIEVCFVMEPKPLMKLYIDCCEEVSEPPNMTMVRKLYNIEESEDQIVVSDCQLRDLTIMPLLNALLQRHKPLAVLDLSHNQLGNGTVEKLKQVFMSSGQCYGGLFLNLHSNRLGPSALFQICECPVIYGRLEVLNLSDNSLTDACASYLSTVLRTCKALYSLGIENCSITSTTFQKVADSLSSENVLTHLYVGRNYPVSGNAVSSLVRRLATLKRFQELSLDGIKLSKPVVASICQLAKNCCLSGLLLGNTYIGAEGAMQLIQPLSKDTQELVRLDLSFCGVSSGFLAGLRNESSLVSSILELNLGGNPISGEGSSELASLLSSPQCCLRVLVVCKCELSLAGIIRILQALPGNCFLEELNLADNVGPNETQALTEGVVFETADSFTGRQQLNTNSGSLEPERVDDMSHGTCNRNPNENQLEVADSEDDDICREHTISVPEDREIRTSQRNRLSESMPLQELTDSVTRAVNLKTLDLSHNRFSQPVIEMLFSAWSSGSRSVIAQGHVDENVVHLSVKGISCCGIKTCCRKI